MTTSIDVGTTRFLERAKGRHDRHASRLYRTLRRAGYTVPTIAVEEELVYHLEAVEAIAATLEANA